MGVGVGATLPLSALRIRIMGKIAWEMIYTAQKKKKIWKRAGGEDHWAIGLDGLKGSACQGRLGIPDAQGQDSSICVSK